MSEHKQPDDPLTWMACPSCRYSFGAEVNNLIEECVESQVRSIMEAAQVDGLDIAIEAPRAKEA